MNEMDGQNRNENLCLSEKIAAEEFEKKISRNYIDLLSRNIPGGMIGAYLEEDFPLYHINGRMLSYLGYTYGEFVQITDGNVSSIIHPGDRDRVCGEMRKAFSEGVEYEGQYRVQKKEGSYFWVNAVGRKSISEEGRSVFVNVIRDIFPSVEFDCKPGVQMGETESQSARYEHLFQSVLCGIVQYKLEPNGSILFKSANKEAIRIFGYHAKEFWLKKRWNLAELIAVPDRLRILEEAKLLKKAGDKNGYQYRLLRKDSTCCWVIGSAEIIVNPQGDEVIQSVFLDIDSWKKAEQQNQRLSRQVEAGNKLLKMAQEHMNSCEFYYYPREHTMQMPARTQERYQCAGKYENMPGSFADEFVHQGFHSVFCAMYERINRGETTASADFKDKTGKIWSRILISTIDFNEENEPIFAVGVIEDITKKKEMEIALAEAKSRDRLTNLYTKEAGIALVQKYMKGKPAGQVCALMLIDMDDFGRLNTEEGNVFADIILQDVASILREETRRDDIQIRLGGDEFMLFVKDCNKARAAVIGPQIARRVEELYSNKHHRISVSCSIGMCVTAVADEYFGLYRCAESALLYVKGHEKGKAACYLDTSVAEGIALTEFYKNAHTFNGIESHAAYEAGNIMKFALELLGNSKRLDDAIFLLLSRIGGKYGLDRITILEMDQEYMSYRYAHQWARHKGDYQPGCDHYLNVEQYQEILSQYDEEGLSEKPIYSSEAMASCLQTALWNQGVYAGAMQFESREEGYSWTEEQRRFIVEIAKLIASFILKARADAISKAKTDFLSRMSHEIRTPMNAISGMTMLAKSVLDDRQKALDCLDKIEMANKYLLGLVNDILDMSRIESGKLELNQQPLDMGRLLRELEDLTAPQTREKDLKLVFINQYSSGRAIMADELRVNQILINILGNAVKFTPAGGSITVTVKVEEETPEAVVLRFSIRDTGIGMSRETASRIFSVFEQESKTTTARYGGTGLGLSISSRLVQMMGGILEVESELGQGSDFHFILSFPFAQRQARAGEPERCSEAHNLEELAGKRILIAEDNELNCEIAVSLLEMNGFLVESAADGEETISRFCKMKEGYYDLILMDIRMPVMDGLEATKKIRTMGKADSRRIPIVAMTANAFDEDTKKSLDSGMNGHLTKPIEVDKLLEMIGKCLCGSQQERAL